MFKKKFSFLLLPLLILFMAVTTSPALAADEEALGRTAEQAGKTRQALNHYVAALQSTSEGSSKDQQLREKIIKLAQKIQPPPALPEEAERHLARGIAAVNAATNEEGYLRAAKEFREALRAAPWFADGYYNLGAVLDKAGKYDKAIQNLKLYLVAVPNAKDAKNLIYEIEYRKEDAQTTASEFIRGLEGRWAALCEHVFDEDPGDPGRVTIYTFYDVSASGKNSLTITFARESEYRPSPAFLLAYGGRCGSGKYEVIEATLTGLDIRGTLTAWYDTNPQRKKYPVTGKVSQDGRRITLKSPQQMDGISIGLLPKRSSYTMVLQKQE